MIQDGVVVNVVEARPEEVDGTTIVDITSTPAVFIGWTFADGVFTEPAPQPEPVPAEVTMRQARIALSRAGLLSSVQTAINSLPEPTKTEAQIEWDYSNTVQRHNPFTRNLAGALGLNDAALDDLFRTADAL
jgi:hypothetical protein